MHSQMELLAIDVETENGIRLHLLMDHCRNTLLTFMHQYIPEDPNELYQFLNKRANWRKLNKLRHKDIIKADQWKCMFPNTCETDSKQFDTPTVILLLKTVSNVDQVFLRDLEDLRTARNKLAHSPLKISNDDFLLRWEDVERPLLSLGANKEEIEKSKTCYIDHNLLSALLKSEKNLKTSLKQTEKLEKSLEGVWWGIFPQIRTFTGRENELFRVHEELNSGQYIAVALYGLSGVGKSEIARVYCHKYGMDYYEGNVMWINAEDKNTTEKSFLDLAQYIGLTCTDEEGKALDGKVTVARVYNYFSQKKCLFVFDNTKDHDLFQQYMPANILSTDMKPYILITSQFSQWTGTVKEQKIDTLTKEETTILLSSNLSGITQIEDSDLNELAHLLGYLPLSVHLATAYIKKHHISVHLYITRFKDYFHKIWIKDVTNLNINTHKTILTTWNMALAEISKHSLASKLIELFAIMDGKCIDLQLLLKLDEVDEIDLDEALDTLSCYSLIDTFASDDGTSARKILLHSLVQKVILSEFDQNKFSLLLEQLCSAIKSLTECRSNIKHIGYGNMWLNHMFCSVEEIAKQCPVTQQVFPCILNSIRAFWNTGQIKTAIQFINSVKLNLILTVEQSFKLDFAFAKCVYKEGKFEEAKSLLQELSTNTPIGCESSGDSFKIKRKIGKCLYRMGYYSDALVIFKTLSTAFRTVESDTDDFSLKLKLLVGKCILIQGNNLIAETVFEELCKMEEILHGEYHEHVLTSKSYLADCFFQQGLYQKAMDVYEYVYEQHEKVLGESNPSTLVTKHKIANCFLKQGLYQKAMDVYEYVYEQKKKLLGESNPSTLVTKHEIANCFFQQGLYQNAMDVYEYVYEQEKKLLGESNPSTLVTKHEIANCFLKQGLYQKAMDVYEYVYEQRKNLLGESNPSTLATKHEIANCFFQQGLYQKAMDVYEYVYQQEKKLLGESNPSTLITKSNVAYCYKQQGYHTEALQILLEVYEQQRQLFGESHPSTVDTERIIHDFLDCT